MTKCHFHVKINKCQYVFIQLGYFQEHNTIGRPSLIVFHLPNFICHHIKWKPTRNSFQIPLMKAVTILNIDLNISLVKQRTREYTKQYKK